MAKTTNQWIDLTYPGGLTAGDIHYNATQTIGDIFDAIGGGVVGQYFQYDSDNTERSTTDEVNWQTQLTLTTPSLPSGIDMEVAWYYEMAGSNNSRSFQGRVIVDGSTVIQEIQIEPKDKDDWVPIGGFGFYTTTTAAIHTIAIEYKSLNEAGTHTTYIRNARLKIRRVA